MYVVDLELSLCFESSQNCETVETLFDETKLYRLPCTWNALFVKKSRFRIYLYLTKCRKTKDEF